MASSSSSSSSSKPAVSLAELLEEKQEPFILDLYLLERSYGLTRSQSKFTVAHHHSKKNLDGAKTSSSSRRMMKSFITKIISYRSTPHVNLSKFNCKPRPTSRITSQHVKFTSSYRKSKVAATRHEWRCIEDYSCSCSSSSNQLSPVSVLELVLPDDFSAWLDLDEPVQLQRHFLTRTKRGKERHQAKTINSILQQNFLDDDDDITASRRPEKRSIDGASGLESIPGKEISSWRKKPGNFEFLNQLIGSDFYNPTQKWSDFRLLSRYIGIDIGEAIFDAIVEETISA